MILVDFTLLTFFHTLFWPFLRFTATLSHLACQVIGRGSCDEEKFVETGLPIHHFGTISRDEFFF